MGAGEVQPLKQKQELKVEWAPPLRRRCPFTAEARELGGELGGHPPERWFPELVQSPWCHQTPSAGCCRFREVTGLSLSALTCERRNFPEAPRGVASHLIKGRIQLSATQPWERRQHAETSACYFCLGKYCRFS